MDKHDALSAEIGTGLSFASAMSAVSLFFAGFIIAEYDKFEETRGKDGDCCYTARKDF